MYDEVKYLIKLLKVCLCQYVFDVSRRYILVVWIRNLKLVIIIVGFLFFICFLFKGVVIGLIFNFVMDYFFYDEIIWILEY